MSELFCYLRRISTIRKTTIIKANINNTPIMARQLINGTLVKIPVNSLYSAKRIAKNPMLIPASCPK